ncbi:hypothetical protein K490DRAFT_67657 [Saccharata proteae CBS 121410]|uniref:BTB domain-containing protein n=1 Tax=Saccharata proteae CBS 121410 TaxID=1314787 RepID=A0A9P4LWV9_9PEZI|nr:hypothetical protein K490DRAFT_67657 [Saccharata proteae CBS 121410]
MDAPQTELLSAFATLYDEGKYSDLTVVSGHRRFAVHKAIICSRSSFFDGACSNPFREAASGIIDLSEDDAEAVEHMIHYFYHLDYLSKAKSRRSTAPSSPMSPTSPVIRRTSRRRPKKLNLALVEDPLLAQAALSPIAIATPQTPPSPIASPVTMDAKIPPHDWVEDSPDDDVDSSDYDDDEAECDADQPHLVLHAKVYAIAEKYGITGLKALAKRKYAAQLEQHWIDAEFADSIQEVYETTIDTDRGLRDLVIQAFREHPELARRKDVEFIVKDTPGIAWELFRVGWGMPCC